MRGRYVHEHPRRRPVEQREREAQADPKAVRLNLRHARDGCGQVREQELLARAGGRAVLLEVGGDEAGALADRRPRRPYAGRSTPAIEPAASPDARTSDSSTHTIYGIGRGAGRRSSTTCCSSAGTTTGWSTSVASRSRAYPERRSASGGRTVRSSRTCRGVRAATPTSSCEATRTPERRSARGVPDRNRRADASRHDRGPGDSDLWLGSSLAATDPRGAVVLRL
jgi:hypothetical protein